MPPLRLRLILPLAALVVAFLTVYATGQSATKPAAPKPPPDIFSFKPKPATQAATAPATLPANTYEYHRTETLGTFLDMTIVAPTQTDADLAANAAYDEIERLRLILSTYDPAAELAKINALPADAPPTKCSPELVEVLLLYDEWNEKSNGAYNGHLGDLLALYKQAETTGVPPTEEQLAPVVKQLSRPAWIVNDALKTVQRITPQQININSLGKGYIIAHAVAAAKKRVPALVGMLLNIGGDLTVTGSSSATESKPWRIGVGDPADPAANAPPLVTLLLRDQAVATSGSYARFYTIKDHKYSHIMDPRTGQPADAARSATVVAKDNATANALATTCCVLSTAEAIRLVQGVPDASCLIVGADGAPHYSAGFRALEAPADPKAAAASQPSTFPRTQIVTVEVSVKPGAGGKDRPCLGIWVEDAKGNPVKLLQAFGSKPADIQKMPTWSKIWTGFRAANRDLVAAVTQAAPNAGQYSFKWDGSDTKGQQVPQGKYTLRVAAATERISEITGQAVIICADKPDFTRIKSSTLYDDITITYGPRNK